MTGLPFVIYVCAASLDWWPETDGPSCPHAGCDAEVGRYSLTGTTIARELPAWGSTLFPSDRIAA